MFFAIFAVTQFIPHTKIRGVTAHRKDGQTVRPIDIGGLKMKYPYVAIAPQWDFLKLLAEGTGLIYQNHKILGVEYVAAGTKQKLFFVIPRARYAQIANIIPKGSDRRLREAGSPQLRSAISQAVPATRQSDKEFTWDNVKCLDIKMNRLTR